MRALRNALAGLPGLGRASVAVLLLFVAVLCWLLGPEWTHNPDLSHGLFMPVIFLFLVFHSRREGPWRPLSSRASTGLGAALACAGLALVVLAGLYAAVLDWSHALVLFLLACALASFLASGIAALADERLCAMPWNWTALAAAVLWPLCAPIPPGTYSRLTAALQLWVSTRVVQTLHLIGVAAYRSGNIIELAHARVGVEEACSGVRSLVSCVFAGLFFSASLVTRPGKRILIIVLSPLLALAMNFLRSLSLTLMADHGVRIEGFWHDATGYAVLGLTTVLLGALALVLGREPPRETAGPPPAVSGPAPTSPAIRWLAGGLAAALLLLIFFARSTHPYAKASGPAPDLLALLPASEAGWQVRTAGDLSQFKDLLQTDRLAQRTYRRGEGPGATEIILYLAYWSPGQAPVSLVALHTPDACWPGAGWVQKDNPEDSVPLRIGGAELPNAESRLFTHSGYPEHVWFWHLYEGRPIPYQNPYSLAKLLGIAWRYGFRHNGDQLFVRVSSNRPWSEIAREPVLQDFFARLRPLGLGGTITIQAYADIQPMLEAIDRLFVAAHPGFSLAIAPCLTRKAAAALTDGTTPFAPMGAEFEAAELDSYRRAVGGTPIAFPVAHDPANAQAMSGPVGIFVHPSNPIAALTTGQVEAIFTRGGPDRWGQLGASGSWAQKMIQTCGVPFGVGIGVDMRDQFHGRPCAERFRPIPQSRDIIKFVASHPGAIGYARMNLANATVKLLAIDAGRGPSRASNEDLISGRYPYDRMALIYVRPPLPGWVRDYLRVVYSRSGQDAIAASPPYYLPLNRQQAEGELARLDRM